ncbi:MAG TPA: hypothetical protein VN605_12255, partial [Thermoanaerobaculia bacterium]|nr:hypothetical protein [Thermoanaerobaculia bacterium]
FVVPAQPSIDVSFSPHPSYWVTFGDYVKGQVLDTQQVTKKAEVPYDNNVYAMYAILGRNNQWTITSIASVNKQFLSLSAAGSDAAVSHRDAINALTSGK